MTACINRIPTYYLIIHLLILRATMYYLVISITFKYSTNKCINTTNCTIFQFNISFLLPLSLPSCHFTRIFHSKILHAPFFSPTQSAGKVHRIFVDLITLEALGGLVRLRSHSLCTIRNSFHIFSVHTFVNSTVQPKRSNVFSIYLFL